MDALLPEPSRLDPGAGKAKSTADRTSSAKHIPARAPPAPKKRRQLLEGAGTSQTPKRQRPAGEATPRAKGKGKQKQKQKEALEPVSQDPNVVLRKVRELRKEEELALAEDSQAGIDEESPGIPGTEARFMSEEDVMLAIENIALHIARTTLAGQGFGYRLPAAGKDNQEYDEKAKYIRMKDKVTVRKFAENKADNVSINVIRMTRLLGLVYELLRQGIHSTKRDLFYCDVKLFVVRSFQKNSDALIEDLAKMIGCTRDSLNVVASDKSLIVGNLSFKESGDFIDCRKIGGGKTIRTMDRISDIRNCGAEFILLVEKDAVFSRLAEDRFYEKYPCIIITPKGQADVAVRMMVHRLRRELNLPILGLMDSDGPGLEILSVFVSGSKNMAHDSRHLATSGIKWLGVLPSDLDLYKIPEQCRLPMTEADIKKAKVYATILRLCRGEGRRRRNQSPRARLIFLHSTITAAQIHVQELLQEDYIQQNPDWARELQLMLKNKVKAEIQALSAFGFQFLTTTYLPQKLKAGHWI